MSIYLCRDMSDVQMFRKSLRVSLRWDGPGKLNCGDKTLCRWSRSSRTVWAVTDRLVLKRRHTTRCSRYLEQQHISDDAYEIGSDGFGSDASSVFGFSQDEGEELQKQHFLLFTTKVKPKTIDRFSGEFCHFYTHGVAQRLREKGSKQKERSLTGDDEDDNEHPVVEHVQLKGPDGPRMLQL